MVHETKPSKFGMSSTNERVLHKLKFYLSVLLLIIKISQ